MNSLVRFLQKAGQPIRSLHHRGGSYFLTIPARWERLNFMPMSQRKYVRLDYQDDGTLFLHHEKITDDEYVTQLLKGTPLRTLYNAGNARALALPIDWVRRHLTAIEDKFYVTLAYRPEDNALVISPFSGKDWESFTATEKPDDDASESEE